MRRTRFVVLAGIAALGIAAFASAAVGSGANAPAWKIVALGDSGASGRGDATGLAWSGRYARLLRQRFHHEVTLTNLAQDGKSSAALLSELRFSPSTRAAVKQADIILFGSTAGASLNSADTKLQAKECVGKACYAVDLQAWARDFEQIVATAAALRGNKKTVLRGVTDANVIPGAQDVIPPYATIGMALYLTQTINEAICASLKKHRGRCIDVLTAFNGPSGTKNAYARGLMNKVDCCYASSKGQQLIAKLLLETGIKPLR